MIFDLAFLLAQGGQVTEPNQSEYLLAYALIAAAVILGLLAICLPRTRGHFIEPEEEGEKTTNKR